MLGIWYLFLQTITFNVLESRARLRDPSSLTVFTKARVPDHLYMNEVIERDFPFKFSHDGWLESHRPSPTLCCVGTNDCLNFVRTLENSLRHFFTPNLCLVRLAIHYEQP